MKVCFDNFDLQVSCNSLSIVQVMDRFMKKTGGSTLCPMKATALSYMTSTACSLVIKVARLDFFGGIPPKCEH